jgi:hypothetical protein
MLEKATCIKLSGTPHRDDVYQQFSLEAITADCKWSLKVENAEKKTLDITFAVAGDVTNDVSVITFTEEKKTFDVTIGMLYSTYVPEGWSVTGLQQMMKDAAKATDIDITAWDKINIGAGHCMSFAKWGDKEQKQPVFKAETVDCKVLIHVKNDK